MGDVSTGLTTAEAATRLSSEGPNELARQEASNPALLFFARDRVAAWLLVPYLAWVTFASALNLAIAVMNRV